MTTGPRIVEGKDITRRGAERAIPERGHGSAVPPARNKTSPSRQVQCGERGESAADIPRVAKIDVIVRMGGERNSREGSEARVIAATPCSGEVRSPR